MPNSLEKHGHVETMYDIINKGKVNGIWHLYDEAKHNSGRTINVSGRDLVNFGSCSYLGLDFDPRLAQGVINAVRNHGTQVSSSRTYVSSGLYLELEDLFKQLFGHPVVIAPSTTLGHLSSIPVIVQRDHAIILDQSVHASVQEAVQGAKARGVTIDIIRHNRMDWLEDKVKKLKQKHDVIWYMADGIYSMFGDECPVEDVLSLMDKYEQLYFYVDDAHGLSWAGENGRGFILDKVKMHERMILTTSLHKAFGTTGGVIVCPNEALAKRIKFCGNTLVFSGPIVPPMLGASIESAKIHLSDEIYALQKNLNSRVDRFNNLIDQYNLPTTSLNNSPINFIGVGQPNVGYNMVQRLMKEGYYTNLAMFPAVPIKKTGIRICTTLHQTPEDIDNLMQAINYHLPQAIQEENWTRNKIQKAFDLPVVDASEHKIETKETLRVVYHTNADKLDPMEWNKKHGKTLNDYNCLCFLEKVFSGNQEKENNWGFHYFIVYDAKNEIVVSTFFTNSIWKDDMLARKEVSQMLEKDREENGYHMTTQTLSMGCLLTEGNHLYCNTQHKMYREAMNLMLEKVYQIQEKEGAASIVLRDFNKESDVEGFLINAGFFKANMPDNHLIDISKANSFSEYYDSLSKNSKRHFKRYIFPFEDKLELKILSKATEKDVDHWYELYLNVKNNSLELNTFDLPKKLFHSFIERTDLWDIVTLTARLENEERVIAVLFSYKNDHVYCPLIIGLDYDYMNEYGSYRQIHYQAIKRAISLGCKQIRLAFSSSIEKQRIGAKVVPTVIFADSKDNFNIAAMNVL